MPQRQLKRERIRKYRKLAGEASKDAAKATEERVRKSFEMLAEGWQALADSLEREFRD